MTTTLLLLYGLCAWGAFCNAFAWARLFWQRLRGDRSPILTDVYLGVRAGMLLSAIGTVGLAGDRVGGQLIGNLLLSVPSEVGVASIAAMAAAEALFLHVTALRARARGTPAWAWRAYWTGAALWSGYVLLAT